MHVVLLIDASTSMLSGDKLLRAQQFAAAFGIMGMLNLERVSVYGIHTAGVQPTLFPPSSGRTKIRPLLKFLEQLEGGGAIPLEQSIETMLRFHRGRGVAVLLSDFLTLGDLSRPFNMLYSAGLEPWGLQILSEAEEFGASLIVMTTQKRDGILDTFRGSVADKVVRGAPCPVLAVPVGA